MTGSKRSSHFKPKKKIPKKAMTNIKSKNIKTEVSEKHFFEVENEFGELEKSFIINRIKKHLPQIQDQKEFLQNISLEDLIKFLKKQNDLLQAGEVLNNILIARIKSLIIKN